MTSLPLTLAGALISQCGVISTECIFVDVVKVGVVGVIRVNAFISSL